MANSDSSKLDFRVVELWKTSAENTLAQMIKDTSLEDDATNRYVCLGHFDSICVKPLDASDPLSAIENDSKARDNYCHPLYILHDTPQKDDLLDQFWQSPFCFMTISRVHFSLSERGNPDALRAALVDLSDDKNTATNYLGDMSILVNAEVVHIAFYSTLELGDIVMVLKSNAITACLEVIRRIMEVSTVGDVYSFCGVHYALVEDKDVNGSAARWDERNGEKSPYFTSNAKQALKKRIPHVSMRFSIVSTKCAKLLWDKMSFSPAFISGTADALELLDGQTVAKLICSIHHLIFDVYTENNKKLCMHDAFEDVITRIGTEYGQPYVHSLEAKPRVLPGNLPRIREELRRTVGAIEERCQGSRWFSLLKAQTDTLIAMMGNCVTDDLSMLIIPSVRALLDRLNYITQKYSRISRNQETNIGKFLNDWDILESDISRLEGQLSQNPELTASRYYIPATLMAFYMALLSKYNELLLTIDGEDKRGYVPLITYNSAPRAFTNCILDPVFDKPSGNGPPPYKGDTPLLVSLPVTMMYKPLETTIVLCHEMSHYTGTSTRLREERFEQILAGCAGKIAKVWMLDGQEPFHLDPDGALSVLERIKKKLVDSYKSKVSGAGSLSGGYYISQLLRNLPEVITDVYYDQKFRSSLVQLYVPRDRLKPGAIAYAQSFDIYEQYKTLDKFKSNVQNMLILYRECYADLMDILTLRLTKEEYLLYMFYREAQYLREADPTRLSIQPRMAELQLQAAVVLYVIPPDPGYQPFPLSLNEEQKAWIDNITAVIDKYQRWFGKEQDIPISKNAVLLQSEYMSLIKYLKQCEKIISDKLASAAVQQATDFREIIDGMRGQIDLHKIQEIVARYRTQLLLGDSKG